MVEDWQTVNFTMTQYRDSGVSILASVDDILMLLEDQIVRIQTMRGSPFIKPLEKEIREWEDRMIRMQETIDEWLKVQAQWLYLDPIFSSEDIMQQMPEEGQMFQVVDNNWRQIMKNTVQQPLVRNVPLVVGTSANETLASITDNPHPLTKMLASFTLNC